MTNFLVDSSAWVEYLKGTLTGVKIAKIIESRKNNCFYPNPVIAEVLSKTRRDNSDIKTAISGMKAFAKNLNETEREFINGGLIHAELKLKKSEISLADAIIIAASRKNNLKILTCDFHLKEFNSTYIKKHGKQ